jgi:hypothetical protein
MTAKEGQEELAAQEVRKVHPCAFRSAKGTVWSERGMTKIRLGTTWKNAAESLPAQPGQNSDPSFTPDEESVFGSLCLRIIENPFVISSLSLDRLVEAALKATARRFVTGRLIHESCNPIAEMRPTLATPVDQSGFNEGVDAAAAFLRSKYGVKGWDCLDFARALHDLKRFPEVRNAG